MRRGPLSLIGLRFSLFFLVCSMMLLAGSEGSGRIEHDHHLVAIFGPKAEHRQKALDDPGYRLYPENPDPDPASEWLFPGLWGMSYWDQGLLGAPIHRYDYFRNDKTVLNATFHLSNYIPEYFKDGYFMNPRYFHVFVRVVNKDALLQWDMWFTGLSDMCAIKLRLFNPEAPIEDAIKVKDYLVVAYAAGSLDAVAQGGRNNSFSLANPLYGDAEAEPPIDSGVNRLVLQVVGIQRVMLKVNIGWSDMVYQSSALTPENLVDLSDTTGRNLTSTGWPFKLRSEDQMLENGSHYGLNATGEVRYYGVGEDPDPAYHDIATYRVPVRQAMWRAETGAGQIIQTMRGWSYKAFPAVQIPEKTEEDDSKIIAGFLVASPIGILAIYGFVGRKLKGYGAGSRSC